MDVEQQRHVEEMRLGADGDYDGADGDNGDEVN